MMDQMVKDNKVIKIIINVILSFFALVFVMGFFSKSITNHMIPEVKTVPAMENTSIKKTVKIEGVIKPKETYKVRLDRNVIVQEYFVKVGDKVDIGKPVFRINNNYGGNGNSEYIEELNLQLQDQQFQLENLQNSSVDIEKKNITVLRDKLKSAQEEVINQQILFEAGAISMSQLEKSKLQLEEQIINFETDLIVQENQKKDNQYLADKIKYNIERIKQEINDLNAQQKFYSHLDNEGLYYAENEGIILTTRETDVVISKDTIIAEIGIVDGLKSVKFVSQIDPKDLDILEDAGYIEITNEDNSKNKILVTKISKLANNSKLQLEGQFANETKRNIIIDEELQGTAVKTYKNEGFHSIPKTAINCQEELQAGNSGSVFIIEEKDGVLGKETIAKEVKVEIKAVGDDKVIVEGLINYQKPELINNLSYKIRDGVRVYLCK